jgi:hypothetical protein
MQSNEPTRLDRIESAIAQLVEIARSHEDRTSRLEDIVIGQQALMGLLSDQTAQLKRTIDYLLSKDGGSNAN